jgi:hypothetical protein
MSKLIALGIVAIVVGTSVVAWSASPTKRAEALTPTTIFSVSEIQRGIDTRTLPETEMVDMTFIFVEHE